MAPTERIVQLVGVAAAVTEKAAELAARGEQQEKQAQALIPGCVEALLASGLLQPAEKQAAEQQLADPVKRLEILTNFGLEVAAQKQAAAGAVPILGGPPTATAPAGRTKKAAYDSLTSPYVGARRPIEDTVSAQAFRSRMGLAPAAN